MSFLTVVGERVVEDDASRRRIVSWKIELMLCRAFAAGKTFIHLYPCDHITFLNLCMVDCRVRLMGFGNRFNSIFISTKKEGEFRMNENKITLILGLLNEFPPSAKRSISTPASLLLLLSRHAYIIHFNAQFIIP